MLRVRLGDVAAERDGEPMALSGPHRRLLAFLALHPGPHERDALAARFWPDLPTARANLRTAVWALRRALGADAVHTTRTSVALASVVRDVDEVGQALADGDLSALDATACVEWTTTERRPLDTTACVGWTTTDWRPRLAASLVALAELAEREHGPAA